MDESVDLLVHYGGASEYASSYTCWYCEVKTAYIWVAVPMGKWGLCTVPLCRECSIEVG